MARGIPDPGVRAAVGQRSVLFQVSRGPATNRQPNEGDGESTASDCIDGLDSHRMPRPARIRRGPAASPRRRQRLKTHAGQPADFDSSAAIRRAATIAGVMARMLVGLGAAAIVGPHPEARTQERSAIRAVPAGVGRTVDSHAPLFEAARPPDAEARCPRPPPHAPAAWRRSAR